MTLQYQFTERNETVKIITFKNSIALNNVEKIQYFKEEGVSGTFEKKEFRYSFNNVNWTNWNTLSQTNLSNIPFNDEPNFYLELRYTRAGVGSANIQSFYLFYIGSFTPPVPGPTDASIDADYLGGQPPIYYLDRANHIGPYSSLIAENILGGFGTWYNRLDTSVGTTLRFKAFADSSTVTITEDGSSGLLRLHTSGSATGVYVSNLDPSVQMPDPVGGIPAGTYVSDLEGDTFSSLWDNLLFPTAFPALISPNNSFSDNVSNLQEIGAIINITFTANFSRGAINPQYPPTSEPFRSGLPNSYNYTGVGLVDVFTNALSNSQTVTNYTVISGIQTWTNIVNYDAGVQPYDSKGNPYSSPLPAGSTSSKSTTFEGVYPLFGTTVTIVTLTQQSLVSMINANNIQISLVSESGGNKQKIDIPNTWLVSRPLVGIQQFNTASNSWEYPGGSAAASLAIWSTSSTSHIIQGNGVGYTQYTHNGSDRGDTLVRLVF